MYLNYAAHTQGLHHVWTRLCHCPRAQLSTGEFTQYFPLRRGGAVPPDRTGGTTAVRALDCHVSHLQKHQLCQQQGARRRAGALLIARETCYCRGCCACIPS